MIEALPYREVENAKPFQKRILFCDPLPYYERIQDKIDPLKRMQSRRFFMNDIFPQEDKSLCACGCGKELTGRRTRWASKECSEFAVNVYWIFYGDMKVIRKLLFLYYGYGCSSCGEADYSTVIHIDHIVPVVHGGGGCWLNNYQPLCVPCHKDKTKEDFGWCQEDKSQLKLEV